MKKLIKLKNTTILQYYFYYIITYFIFCQYFMQGVLFFIFGGVPLIHTLLLFGSYPTAGTRQKNWTSTRCSQNTCATFTLIECVARFDSLELPFSVPKTDVLPIRRKANIVLKIRQSYFIIVNSFRRNNEQASQYFSKIQIGFLYCKCYTCFFLCFFDSKGYDQQRPI